MITLRYRAARADGRVVSGNLVSASEEEGRQVLQSRGLAPLELGPAGETFRWSAPGRRDLAVTFRSLAALVEAGASLDRAVIATGSLPRHPALRSALAEARWLLGQGLGLSQALAASPGVFPSVCLGVLRAGERAGRLGPALGQVADQLEQEADLTARVRQALVYPSVLALVGLGSLAVIATVIVPRFAELLADLNQALPPATKALLGISAFMQHYGVWVLLAAVGGAVFLASWSRSPEVRPLLHEHLLRLPVIGRLRRDLAAARICRALSGLAGAGLPILSALDGAADAAGDAAIRERLRRVRARVAQGATITASLDAEGVLPPGPLQLIAVGESSARVGPMAERAAELAAQEAERGLRTMVSLLEPALVVGFGAVVAFVAAALLQAAYSLRPAP